jgi:very-short-patch-repair endonuclease
MGDKGPNQLDLVLAWRGDRQFGVVSRVQLLADGVHFRTIADAIAKKRLRPLFEGVYAIGHTAIRREGWWLATLLACGEGAVLAERSAAQLWRYLQGPVFPITVFVAGDRGRKREGIEARRVAVHEHESVLVDGIRVTTQARTMVDVNANLGPPERRELAERAQDLRRFHPARIRECLARHPRQPGRRPLLDLLDLLEPAADGTRSHLERLFLPLARRARMGRPLVNERIAGRERDFAWPALRLVVEVDGHAFHSSRAAIRRDKARDRELLAAGWRPARFTYEDVAFEPDDVVGELRSIR